MSTPIILDKDALNSALTYIWRQYLTWSTTSRSYKNEVTRWRNRVLLLSVVGAILGTLSQQLSLWESIPSWFTRTLGFLSGAALVLAAYFGKEVFSPDPETKAVRARAAAEAFKSEAYLLATGTPPYDTATTTEELFEKTEKVRKTVENIAALPITPHERKKEVPSAPMSVDDYISQRVDQQINEFFLPEAKANEKKVATSRALSFSLGALAVVLGLLSAKYASVAGWIAVIGTITAAIAARQYAGRYQFLIVSYQATAERLEWLKTRWDIERKTQGGAASPHRFILACEQVLSTENSAWMAQWTKKADDSASNIQPSVTSR